MQRYISLHNHDTYSLLDGLYKPSAYLEHIKKMGATAYAQTNHGNLTGVFDFYDSAKKYGIKPILGMEAYFVDDKSTKDKPYHILLLAKNFEGYQSILRALYDGNKNGFYYKPRIDWNNLKDMAGNVIVSSACSSGIIAKPILQNNLERVKEVVYKMKDIFGGDFYFEYIALGRIEFYKSLWTQMYELSKQYDVKSIITTDTHYIYKSDYKLQQILHNVQNKVTKEDLAAGKGRVMDDKDLYIKSYDDIMEIMTTIFEVPQVEEFLNNTLEINNKIEEYDIYPKGFVFPKIDFREDELKTIIRENLDKKCPAEKKEEYRQRLNYEYKVIKSLGFLEYFWIVQDIVRWAKQNNIFVGAGRGSAAGSLVSYLLDITEIDPMRFNLSFERFLNPKRKKMPDIDIDFQKNKRQQVLSYIKKYGVDNVIQICAYSKLSVKSALKDVLRIYGVPYEEANQITKRLDEAPKQVKQMYPKYMEIAEKLQGNIRHLTKHAAGVVITDKPACEYMPTVYSVKAKEITSAIDGDVLTSKKFLKMDILGLSGLDIVNDTLEYIKQHEHKNIDINHIPLNDVDVYNMFRILDVDNIFQFDTKLMKELLEEIQPDRFKHLVELNALNRPGPLSIHMDVEYAKRRFGSKYVIPVLLEPHLKETYGLLLYQEQIMNILADWLDIDFGFADTYRRELEFKSIKDLFNEHNYYHYLYKKYEKKDVEEAISFLEQSMGYTFNKSHSVSYSFFAYQMAYLKFHYRKYFNLAVLNNEDDEVRIRKTIRDSQSHKITVNQYNINNITFNFILDDNGNIIPGAKMIKGIGEKGIMDAVEKKPYKSMRDFLNRTKVNKRVLEILNGCGFFKNAFGEEYTNQQILDMKSKKGPESATLF